MNLPIHSRGFKRAIFNRVSEKIAGNRQQAGRASTHPQAPRRHLDFSLRGYSCRIAINPDRVEGQIDGEFITVGSDAAEIARHLIETVMSISSMDCIVESRSRDETFKSGAA